jgi:Bax protein
MISNDPFILVTKLDRYSEKGSLYGEGLASIIRFNDFDDYDKN